MQFSVLPAATRKFYAPLETPTLAMAIVAENSGHGSAIAAPIAGSVLRRVFLPDTSSASRPPIVPAPADSVTD